jgi:hypothetical protein
VSGLNAIFRSIEVAMHPFYSMRPKMMFGRVLHRFTKLRTYKMKNLCFGPECSISGYQSCDDPFYSIRPKMMFGSVSEHFANLRHVKRCKTCVSARNTLFQDSKVAKHPFDYIEPKIMFSSVWEHFTNLCHVKRCKSCVLGQNAIFWVPKLRSIHSTP